MTSSYDEEDELHWVSLQQIAQRQGVAVDAHELSQLPHHVVFTERLRVRIGREPGLHDAD